MTQLLREITSAKINIHNEPLEITNLNEKIKITFGWLPESTGSAKFLHCL